MQAKHPEPRRLALALLLLSTLSTAQDEAFSEGQVSVGEKTYPYRLLSPPELAEGESYPLVLFLHGIGERGSDNALQLRHFPQRMLKPEHRERFPCFLLAPQCPEDQVWADLRGVRERSNVLAQNPSEALTAATSALLEVAGSHPIDRTRVYLTGLSMGGYGAWDLAARQPDWFAGALMVCGGGDPLTAPRLAGLPLSVWHGSADQLVPPARSREMVTAMQKLGVEVDYHELEGVGHDSWGRAYAVDGALEWLFAKRHDPKRSQETAGRLLADSLGADERVAFLGDSITQAGNRPGGYVDLIRSALSRERPDVQVIPAGISGHRVPDLLARFQRDVIDAGATLVFIYIGINDVWHSDSGRGTPADEYERGLRDIVQRLRASGADVVLATPSVIGERASGENRLDPMLEEFSALSRGVARREGATLCDLRAAFHDHLSLFNPEGVERGLLTSDGVHLSSAGDVLLATEAARALRRAVLDRPTR